MPTSRYLANSIENLNHRQKVHDIVTFNCSLHHPEHETHINTFKLFVVINDGHDEMNILSYNEKFGGYE